MIYKMKTEDEIKKIGIYWDGTYWPSQNEIDNFKKTVDTADEFLKFFPSIGLDDLGIKISNNVKGNSQIEDWPALHGINDITFKSIFSWAAEYEMTKETHPEEFL